MNQNSEETDMQKRSKATNLASLRAVVAAYLIYLGFSLILDYMRGRSTLSPVFVWLIGLVFITAGIVFGFYIWRRWCADRDAARFPETEKNDSPDTK